MQAVCSHQVKQQAHPPLPTGPRPAQCVDAPSPGQQVADCRAGDGGYRGQEGSDSNPDCPIKLRLALCKRICK